MINIYEANGGLTSADEWKSRYDRNKHEITSARFGVLIKTIL